MAPAIRFKGFTPEQLRRFGVTFDRGCAVVPYLTQAGEVYREKVFPVAPREGQSRSWWRGEYKPPIPYGLETLNLDSDRMFLTEGESDRWALAVANPHIPVIGLPGASSWQRGWANYLEPFEVVYLCFDGDRSGRAMTDKVWATLGRRARCVPLPRSQDARQVIHTEGVEVFARLVAAADAGAERGEFIDHIAEHGIRSGDAERYVAIGRDDEGDRTAA